MKRRMMTVGEWSEALSAEGLQRLVALENRGFSIIEAPAYGRYRGGLTRWRLGSEVEEQMIASGLDTKGLGIWRRSPRKEG